MIVIFRNFFRNRMVNLTATSVKHFLPDSEFHCITLYKNSEDEYDNQPALHEWIKEHKFQTKFVNSDSNVTYESNHPLGYGTSGVGHPDNGKYFVEGYNLVYNMFSGLDEKLLILSEDHFFTTGATIRELLANNYDVAYAPTEITHEANGGLLSINPNKVSDFFPLPEAELPVEGLLATHLISKIELTRLHKLSTRVWLDYKGDGLHTNGSDVIEEELKKVGIL